MNKKLIFFSILVHTVPLKKDEREMNKKLIFFSIFVRTVPKWNGTVHMWQKLWNLEHLIIGFFGVWCAKCQVFGIWHIYRDCF